MKFVGRILWLLLGLLWRVVVLLLFEKWIPFPDREQPSPAPEPKRARRKKQQARPPARPAPPATPGNAFGLERAGQKRADRTRAPFFAAESSELSPELAAQREGEHWLDARAWSARLRRAAQGDRDRNESLASLLRDKRALRDAIVLGAALGTRHPKR